jgi:hypothetical protein
VTRSISQRASKRNGGWTLLAILLVLSIVSVALVNAALTSGYGVVTASEARSALTARMAALERAGRVPPATGGTIWPDRPEEGFHEWVVASPEGRFDVVEQGAWPAGAAVVLRQWRLVARGDGTRLYQVSARPVDARDETAFVFTRILE